jgi:hypothetical protein
MEGEGDWQEVKIKTEKPKVKPAKPNQTNSKKPKAKTEEKKSAEPSPTVVLIH